MVVIRYHVRDSAGGMHYDRTVAQKDSMVAEGGTVLNTLRYPGEEETPVITTPVEEDAFVPETETSLPGYDPPPEEVYVPPSTLVTDRDYGEPGEAPITEILGVTESSTPSRMDSLVSIVQDPSGLPGYTAPTEQVEPEPIGWTESDIRARALAELAEAEIAPPLTDAELEHRQREAEWTADYIPPVDVVSPLEEIVPEEGITDIIETNLPDPSEFTGIPGPAGGPAPGSVGEVILERVEELIEAEEAFFTGITDPMREFGSELIEASKELPSEGKPLEGFGLYVGGVAAKTAAAVVEGVTEIVRPGLMKEQLEGVGRLVSDVDIRVEKQAEELQEKIDEQDLIFQQYEEGIRTIEIGYQEQRGKVSEIIVERGEYVEDFADWEKAWETYQAEYLVEKGKAETIISEKEKYTPESYAKWATDWAAYESRYLVQIGKAATIIATGGEYATSYAEWETSWAAYEAEVLPQLSVFPEKQESYADWRQEAEAALVELESYSPREAMAEHILSDPFVFAMEVAGGAVGGLIVGRGLGKLLDAVGLKQTQLVRIEGLDVDVKATTLEMVDDFDPLTGKRPFKTLQTPELVMTADEVTTGRIPKIVSEILDPELDQFKGAVKVLGVEGEEGVTRLTKIDLPEGIPDELFGGKPVRVEGALDIETVLLGSDELAISAKELSDEFTIKVPEGEVTFGGPWHKAGVEGVLEKGKYQFDVKGVIVEGVPEIIDDIPDFIPLEPGTGPKTPLGKTFGVVDDAIQASDVIQQLDEVALIKEITEGTIPIGRVIETSIEFPTGLTAGLGLGAALEELTPILEDTVISPSGVDEGLLTGVPLGPILVDVPDIEELSMQPLIVDPTQVDVADVKTPLIVYPDQAEKTDVVLLPPEHVPVLVEDTTQMVDPFKIEKTKPFDITKPSLLPSIVDLGITEDDVQIIDPFQIVDQAQKVDPTEIISPLDIEDTTQLPDILPVVLPFDEPIKDLIIDPVQLQEVIQITPQKPKPLPPIVDQTQIPDVITMFDLDEVQIQDVIVGPIQTLVQKPKPVLPLPHLRFLGPRGPLIPTRQRRPRLRRRRVSPMDPLGFEEREYPTTSIEDIMGIPTGRERRRSPRGASRRGPRDPSELLLGRPKKEKKAKKKGKRKKRRKKG